MTSKCFLIKTLVFCAILKISFGAPSLISSSSLSSVSQAQWPKMRNYDIWDTPSTASTSSSSSSSSAKSLFSSNLQSYNNRLDNKTTYRDGRVLNFFPVPVDDECLSDDGRRSGICLNVYECRIQGGTSRGQCALGFGVCCVFTATCNQEVFNNITYIVSPSFPAIMPKAVSACKLKIKMIHEDISQLRFDFIHFQLGQPNRKTGICDNDFFSIVGGSSSNFTLCGQNSGQHIYYEVGGAGSRQANLGGGGGGIIEVLMNFSQRLFQSRLWEIRVTQIPFSQRAPAGCLQYFFGQEGLIQTFNFAENGRHLANQNYRACVRQETGMCSIAYEPCDDTSFRIGPNGSNGQGSTFMGFPGYFGGAGSETPAGGGGGVLNDGIGGVGGNGVSDGLASQSGGVLSDTPAGGVAGDDVANGAVLNDDGTNAVADGDGDADGDGNPLSDDDLDGAGDGDGDGDGDDDGDVDGDGDGDVDGDGDDVSDDDAADDVANDDPGDGAEEGSGGGDGGGFFSSFTSFFTGRQLPDTDYRHPPPTVHKSKRRKKQLFSFCTDRITLPCIIEDFIGAGMGDIPGCQPIHCGNSLCPSGQLPCRIETSVTPFGLGIHFGDGLQKGSPEDNIGACLRYNQMPCL